MESEWVQFDNSLFAARQFGLDLADDRARLLGSRLAPILSLATWWRPSSELPHDAQDDPPLALR
jgi:hypothetical protein